MKKIRDGAVAFYPSKSSAAMPLLFGIFLLVLCGILFFSGSGMPGLLPWGILAIGVLMTALGVQTLFFSAPICLVYPEKIIISTKQELFWDQIIGCVYRQEWRGAGKSRRLVTVLVFTTADMPSENYSNLTVDIHLLSKRDRNVLIEDLTRRGVFFGPEIKLPPTIWTKISEQFNKEL